jgi:type II secretory pathway component PulF
MGIALAISIIVLLAAYVYLGLKMPGVALVTSPFVAGVLLILGAADDNVWVIGSAVLLFLVALLSILAPKRPPDSEQWPQICAKWILIISVFLLSSICALAVFGPLGVTALVFFFLFLAAVVAYHMTSRHTTAAYIISTIGSSMRQNLPLPMALEAAAGRMNDNRSIILRSIEQWLIQGYSLSEAIRLGYPECPGHAVAMIAAAERVDQVPLAIRALEADMVAKADDRRRIRPVHPFYPVILMIFMFFMLLAMTTFVIPNLKAALMEMISGAKLPVATRMVLKISDFVAYEYGWVIGLGITLGLLVIGIVSIRVRSRPRCPGEPYLISRIGDFIKWHLPIMHRFERDYSMVQTVALLRLSLSAGSPVNDAIYNTLGLDVNHCLKKRLQRWLERVERGDNIAQAARKSRLGSPLAWAFDDKVNQGGTLSILEMLESFYRSNYGYSVNLARFIMWPCVTLVMGAIVGFVVYAIFSPGVEVIRYMTNMVNP